MLLKAQYRSATKFNKANPANWHCALYFACMGILLFSVAASASSSGPPIDIKMPAVKSAEELAKLRTKIDIKTVHPGQTFNLVLIFDIQPQWHIYWKNPGEGSPPPDIVVEVPDGFKVGKTRWPRPIEIDSPIGPTYAYEKQAALFVPITAPEKLNDGRIEIKADVRWAVCRNICLWGSDIQTLKLATSSASKDLNSKESQIDAEIVKLSRRLPGKLESTQGTDSAAASFNGSRLTVTGSAHGLNCIKFFPGFTPGVTYSNPHAVIKDDRFTVNVDIKINRLNSLGKPIVLEGLVALGSKLNDPSYEFQISLPQRSR